MWEWGRTVAEYAAAAAFTREPQSETRPTITDEEFESTDEDAGNDREYRAEFTLVG